MIKLLLKRKDKYNIGIVGSTGLVGRCLIKLLENSNIQIDNLYLFASSKSKGKKIKFKDKEYIITELTQSYYNKIDIYFFTSNSDVSKEHIPKLLNYQNLIIDNSSYYRMNKYVPLIMPYVNINQCYNKQLISNPNCSTIQVVQIVNIINKLFKVKKINYNTYQAVSGSGIKGILDLKNKKNDFYPYLINKTCIPKIGEKNVLNYTSEEIKMINETNKILNNKFFITSTCIRVPIEIGHGVSIYIETKKKINLDKLLSEFKKEKNIIIKDDLENNIFPTSIDTFNNSNIYVGRIRKPNNNTLLLYTASNNLLTGAASNALEIAEKYIENIKY